MLSEIKSSCLWTHCPLCQKYFPALNAANSFSSFRSHIRSHLFIMSFLTTQTLTHPFISALWFCLTWYNKQNLYVYYRKVQAHRKVVRQSWWSLIYPSTRFNIVPLLSLPFYGWTLLSTGFPGGSAAKHPPAVQGLQLQSLGGESPGGGHGNPAFLRILEKPMGRGAWLAIVHRLAKSRTQLKQLNTHALLSKVATILTFYPVCVCVCVCVRAKSGSLRPHGL